MKKFFINLLIVSSLCLFCLGIYGGLMSLIDIPKIKDNIIVLDYNFNKPKIKLY